MPTGAVLREVRRASRPHGVATKDGLRLSQSQIDGLCRDGVLLRRHEGVYVDPAVRRNPRQDLAAAVAAGGSMAAAWGRSAAALWGLVDDFPRTPEIVIPNRRKARIAGVVVHRSTDLCWDHLVERDHIRTTNPLVTTLDLGVVLGSADVAMVIVRARQLGLFEPFAVEATIRRLARQGRTGVRTAREGLELAKIGERPADSILELVFHWMAMAEDLPPYEYQLEVEVDGRVFRIDFAYPAVKVAIEVDGYEMRRSAAAHDYDTFRETKLVVAGWTVIRVTWSRLRADPGGVAADIVTILRNRGYVFPR